MSGSLVGERFGRLVVTAEAPPRFDGSGKKQRMEKCVCDCGEVRDVYRSNLTRGFSTSCGCLTREGSTWIDKL